KNADGDLPLLHQASNENFETVKLLLDKGANPNTENNNSTLPSPLMVAVNAEHTEIVKILLDKGANPNIKDSEGNTPLMQAVSNGNEEIAKLLIGKGADVNAKANDGESVLAIAKDYYGVDEDDSEETLDETPIIKILKKSGAK
ncbi:MAG: Ankyrin, partial [bacterium]